MDGLNNLCFEWRPYLHKFWLSCSTSHPPPPLCERCLFFTVEQQRSAGSISVVKQWRKDDVAVVETYQSSVVSVERTGAALERKCHTGVTKGDNYLLQFLQSSVQFRVIYLTVRVISINLKWTSLFTCQTSLPQKITHKKRKQILNIKTFFCSVSVISPVDWRLSVIF